MKRDQASRLIDGLRFWGFPVLAALLLNGLLIIFVPGLVSPVAEKTPDVESLSGFRLVRINPPLPAVVKTIFPAVEPARPLNTEPKMTRSVPIPQQKLLLPLDLKTDLPAPQLSAVMPPTMDLTLPRLLAPKRPDPLPAAAAPAPDKRVQLPPVTPSPPETALTTPSPPEAVLKSVYTPEEIDRPLVPLVRNPPVYPRHAKRRKIEGWVDIIFIITPAGGVEDIQITASQPPEIFEQPVLRAVSGWRFSPGMVNGNPVRIRVKQRVRFELSHGSD
ncbi:TonB family protein [bacterium]|nr:TonB family protein [bacterium]